MINSSLSLPQPNICTSEHKLAITNASRLIGSANQEPERTKFRKSLIDIKFE